MESEDKDKTVKRYLRGAAKFEQRRENDEARRKRGTRRPSRMKDEDPYDDEESGLEERIGSRRVRAESVREPRVARRVVPNARVSAVARTQVRVLMHATSGNGMEQTVHLTPRVLALGGLVVGDEVEVDASGRVVGRGERRTVLQRRSPGRLKQRKLLAANVDVGLVVMAPRGRDLSLGFLDRAIAALEGGGIPPLIVVTKIDLLEPGVRAEIEDQLQPWARAGIAAYPVSSTLGEGIEALRESLRGKVAVVLGHSGVGKSTLINALDPAALQDTGATREADGRGRHTTTSSRLIPWMTRDGQEPGALVDTPGIRQLSPDVGEVEQIARSIAELVPFLDQCRFRDCAHTGEPGCRLEEEALESPELRRALERYYRLVESSADAD